MKALIVLEDGAVFEGYSFGAVGERCGEVVFNTSLTGYQEIITDPSYKGQIVTMTYPLIGNYGINPQDMESRRPFLEGLIVKEASRIPSNWRCKQTLPYYLKKNNVMGIEGIDTRALTRHIRLKGAMKAVMSTRSVSPKILAKKAKASSSLVGVDLVKEVTCKSQYTWRAHSPVRSEAKPPRRGQPIAHSFKVVVIDCGVKYNILRCLAQRNCEVIVVPCSTGANEILKQKPDGLLLSNGPGDPAAVSGVAETARKLLGKLPIFGICLGNQMLGLALGGKTYKLKFGH
ncbi:MAG: glutamine-hydrolyzing carbamoyl-phosphate synthase small subunit, partial [Candidatus Omnitrophota bacterium]